MITFNKIWLRLGDHPYQTRGLRVLQVVIGLALLFRVFTEAPYASYFWGPNGITQGVREATVPVVPPSLTDIVFSTDQNAWLVLAVLTVSSLGLVFGIKTRLSTVGTCVGFALIQNRLPYLNDGGDNITQIMLIYMMFALPADASYTRGGLKVWFHNLAIVAIFLQLIILYATSGLAKVSGSKWDHGVAVYYISQVEWFSLPGVRHLLTNSVFVTFATYVPMLYQVFFPFAIFSRLKLPWLAVGILFHLGTVAFMGLVTFGTVMIGLELFLITDEEYVGLYAEAQQFRAHPPMLLSSMRSLATSFSFQVGKHPFDELKSNRKAIFAFRHAHQHPGRAKGSTNKNAVESGQESVTTITTKDEGCLQQD